jgi:hypothetical protein
LQIGKKYGATITVAAFLYMKKTIAEIKGVSQHSLIAGKSEETVVGLSVHVSLYALTDR